MREEDVVAMRDAMAILYDLTNHNLTVHGKCSGVTRLQLVIMDRVDRYPGISQSELAELLTSSKQYISQAVNQLRRLGYVEAKTSADDGRAQKLYITPKGSEVMYGEWRRAGIRHTRALVAGLPAEEQEQFINAFYTLRDILPKLVKDGNTVF